MGGGSLRPLATVAQNTASQGLARAGDSTSPENEWMLSCQSGWGERVYTQVRSPGVLYDDHRCVTIHNVLEWPVYL